MKTRIMAQYVTCPNCGANLDPGERCDCQKEKASSKMTPLDKQKASIEKTLQWAVAHATLTQ